MAVAKMAGSAELTIHLHGEGRMGIVGTCRQEAGLKFPKLLIWVGPENEDIVSGNLTAAQWGPHILRRMTLPACMQLRSLYKSKSEGREVPKDGPENPQHTITMDVALPRQTECTYETLKAADDCPAPHNSPAARRAMRRARDPISLVGTSERGNGPNNGRRALHGVEHALSGSQDPRSPMLGLAYRKQALEMDIQRPERQRPRTGARRTVCWWKVEKWSWMALFVHAKGVSSRCHRHKCTALATGGIQSKLGAHIMVMAHENAIGIGHPKINGRQEWSWNERAQASDIRKQTVNRIRRNCESNPSL
ncbi:hypothetical protein BC826DRAFT_971850 [Russula brevipes]|nr:hypothetical protein BC826DRAFT_971850 [Russula brevipes]